MNNERDDYLVGFHFSVSIEDSDQAIDTKFQEVSGLSAELSVEEVQEGGENRYKHKLPNPPKFSNLILKRSLNKADSNLLKWAKKCIYDFNISTKQISVHLLNAEHEAVKSWTFYNAYPIKIALSDFNATQNELVIETIELTYSHFKEGTMNKFKNALSKGVATHIDMIKKTNQVVKYGKKAFDKIF